MEVARVNGAALAYVDAGEGAPAFVFIHGAAGDHRAWAPQVENLSRDHRCIAVDLRGAGESEAAGRASIAQAVDDVAALVRDLNIAPVIVAGHSLGGLVALLVARDHSALVTGTVLAATPVRGDGLDLSTVAASISGDDAGAALAERFVHAGTPPDVRERLRQMAANIPTPVVADFIGSAVFTAEEMRELVRAADRKPFMTLWPVPQGGSFPGEPGDRGGDALWLRDVTMFVRQEPVADAGHYLQLEQPGLVNALLRAFVDDVLRDPRIDHIG